MMATLRRFLAAVHPSRFDPPEQPGLTPELLKCVRATNVTALFGAWCAAAVIPFGLVLFGWWPAPILLGLIGLYALSPLLSRRGHTGVSRISYGAAGLLSIVVFYPVVGNVLAIMTLPAGLGAFTFFSSEEKSYRWLLIALSGLTAAAMNAWTVVNGDPTLVPPVYDDAVNIVLYAIAAGTAISHVRSLDAESDARQKDLVEAAAAARQASEAKEAFLANMSHELRTPMNGVIGMTSMLRTTGLDQDQRRMVDIVHNSGEALLVLLNDVLDLAKMRTGTFQLRPATTPLHEVIEQVGGLFQPTAADKGVALTIVIEQGVPSHVLADSTRLRQLLSNLVGNAVKFTMKGHVELRASVADDGRLAFVIADTGPGIPSGTLDRLFEPFEQLDDGHTRAHGGTGLGLAIVKQLADAMDGTIEVRSDVGAGAVFTVSLPLPAVTPLPREAMAPAAHTAYALVVDDDAISRRVARSMLGHLGLQTVEATSLETCLSALSEQTFDLILLDLHSLAFEASDLARRIRATTTATRTRLCGLLSTGSDLPDADGLDGTIDKPLHLEALEALVTEQLGHRHPHAAPTARSA
jgi:signal transduction histidine kinase